MLLQTRGESETMRLPLYADNHHLAQRIPWRFRERVIAIALYMQGWAILSVQRVSMEPFHIRNDLYLSLFARPSIAHIPLLLVWIRTDHLEWYIGVIIQQPASDSGWNDNQIAAPNCWLKSLRVLFASEAESCTFRNDTENLMGGGVEMGLAVHGILPLGNDFPYYLEAARELSWCGVKGAMVYHERL